jgi:hypothetical protein
MIDLPPPDPGIEISLASRGMSKGLSQTDGPQALIRAELAFGNFYFGASAKNVTSPTSDGEGAALIGLRTKIGGFDLAGSAAWKRVLAPEGAVDINALELAGSLARTFGQVTPRVAVTWSPDDLGSTGRSTFAEVGGSYRVTSALVLSAGLGRRNRENGPDYTAYNAGIVFTIEKRFTLDLRYYDTNLNLGDPYKNRVVLTARAKF